MYLKNKMKKKLEYLVAPGITFLIFFVFFIIKGVVPFGDYNIIHYDMGIQSYPVLTLLYDILHGDRGWIYNFNIGGGAYVYASLVSNGIFSPINWLVSLGTRNQVPILIEWITILKFMIISLSTYYVLKKFYPNLENKYLNIGALLNTFSGYALLYYVNFQWIECWALFPLIIFGMKKIFDGKSGVLFTVTLTMCLLISYYMAWLTLMIIVFGGTWALFFYCEKENRKMAATKILFNTVLSLLMSFVSFYPAFMVSMTSYRMENSTEFLDEINPILFKAIHVLTSPILITYSIKCVIDYKKDKKASLLFGGLLTITLIPLLVEPINKMWHTGSYSGLPFRFGFIVIFIMVCAMMHYFNNHSKDVNTLKLNNVKIAKILIYSFCIINAIFNIYAVKQSNGYQFITGDLSNESISKYYIRIINSVILGCAILFCSEEVKERKFTLKIVYLVFISNLILTMGSFVNCLEEFRFTHSKDSMFFVQDVANIVDEDDLYKIKIDQNLLSHNFSYILKRNTIENWFHFIPKRQVNTLKKLGYSNQKVVQKSNGGTLVSDVLLGVNDIISADSEKDEGIYQKLGNVEDFYYYRYNFKNLPLFKIIDTQDMAEKFCEDDFKIDDVFGVQNDLYKKFFYDTENIIDVKNIDDAEKIENLSKNENYKVESESLIEYDINLTNKSNIYFYPYDIKNCNLYITIKNKNTNEEKENLMLYPDYCYNGILDFGVFDSGDYKIEVRFVYDDELEDEEKTISNLEIGILNLDRFLQKIYEINNYTEDVKFGKDNFSVKINTDEENKSLFIPVNYDEGWRAKNNGENIEVSPILDNYICVKLQKGDNNIEFSYNPPYLELGLKITIVVTAVYVMLVIICKKTKLQNTKFAKAFYTVGFILFLVVVSVFVYKIYINPLFK